MSDTPLVKESVEVLGYVMVVTVRCPCVHAPAVRLVATSDATGITGDLGVCPACARPLSLARIDVNAQDELEFVVTVGEAPASARGTEAAHVA